MACPFVIAPHPRGAKPPAAGSALAHPKFQCGATQSDAASNRDTWAGAQRSRPAGVQQIIDDSGFQTIRPEITSAIETKQESYSPELVTHNAPRR